jgi:hypothetical protein
MKVTTGLKAGLIINHINVDVDQRAVAVSVGSGNRSVGGSVTAAGNDSVVVIKGVGNV